MLQKNIVQVAIALALLLLTSIVLQRALFPTSGEERSEVASVALSPNEEDSNAPQKNPFSISADGPHAARDRSPNDGTQAPNDLRIQSGQALATNGEGVHVANEKDDREGDTRGLSYDEVGRHFPVSQSVQSTCETYSDRCKHQYELLSAMKDQPRDLAWAPKLESRLREALEGDEGAYRVRTIECRLSLCAVEVESTMGRHAGLDYSSELTNQVRERGPGTFGYEKHPNDSRVTVTFRIFERSSKPSP